MQGANAYQNMYQFCQITQIYRITSITFTKQKQAQHTTYNQYHYINITKFE
jgi:hypothetical protein